jgi:hypothetical protein
VDSDDELRDSVHSEVRPMANRLALLGIAAMVVGVTGFALAEEPIPPLPLITHPDRTATPELAQPEVPSPCTFDLDAGWLVRLKTTSIETVTAKVPHPVNCEGAVIRAVTATGNGSFTKLQFTVAYKPGHDRDGIISFAILDDDKQPVTVGEVRDNLDEGANSYLFGTFQIKNREFDRVFATGKKPVMRVTLRIENN